MKRNLLRSLLTLALLSCGPELPAQGQNPAIVKKSASAAISVSTSNGSSTITYGGKVVWSGMTSGKVTGKAGSINGADYAAAFDGDKAIWQNVAGASKHLK